MNPNTAIRRNLKLPEQIKKYEDEFNEITSKINKLKNELRSNFIISSYNTVEEQAREDEEAEKNGSKSFSYFIEINKLILIKNNILQKVRKLGYDIK